ncbi:uncharacterized protein BO95DRAFT_433069 [Aspergillus brunneoviolaceus CBS 621.78]|uniref:Uncharacterized protein n=1 Tax=Aspergillus brunneoviolaceus CBS 621.78 TaxID=1450534 RepID=A0ACD1G5Q3_9EURO|nr:hypothetical protein BO95DRAFT_433069 [Aspergillus brunneoviolaceus CBS 621.78]RAH44476.1 hypothetical protein BO95DRAFT_433069 [Aspergillus brunneoviolaceus CBS 621.78]
MSIIPRPVGSQGDSLSLLSHKPATSVVMQWVYVRSQAKLKLPGWAVADHVGWCAGIQHNKGKPPTPSTTVTLKSELEQLLENRSSIGRHVLDSSAFPDSMHTHWLGIFLYAAGSGFLVRTTLCMGSLPRRGGTQNERSSHSVETTQAKGPLQLTPTY